MIGCAGCPEAAGLEERAMPRDTVNCEAVAPRLAMAVDESIPLTRPQQRHAESCLRCQAEMAQHRKLLRALQSMRSDVIEPSPNLLSDILAGLQETGEQRAIRSLLAGRRAAYLGGLAAATAAGAVSAIVVTTRTRRARLAG
jgi:anti-sigma factor RsiW